MIAIAWAALWAWPVVAIILFRKFSVPVAVCMTILGGYLLLPTRVGVDLPLLPPLDKNTVPTLAAFFLTMIWLHKNPGATSVLPGWLPREPVTLGLLVLLIGGIAGTVVTNRDTLVYGWRVLPGLAPYDGFSILIEITLPLLPMLLGRKLMATKEGQRILLMVLVLGAIAYSVPTLYEVRMSPQLNMMVYGFFPHSFLQHMRQEGFRPIVFMQHGLDLSIFMTLAVIGTVGLMRSAQPEDKLKWIVVIVWLFATLVLSKSLGALLIAMALVPVALFLPPRLQLLAATGITGLVVLYPTLRAAHLIPVDQMLDFALSISSNRAQSLGVRIENEEMLLEKALERPLFGWGIWGRQRVFDEFGNNLSVTDGSWIIAFGVGGWARYIGFYGLLAWPIIGLFLSKRAKIDVICVTLVMILCAKLVDLVPNAGFPAYYMLILGALIGRLEMRQVIKDEKPVSAEKPARSSVYTRGDDLKTASTRVDDPGYARRFPEKEARRSALKAKSAGRARSLSARHPARGAGYRK